MDNLKKIEERYRLDPPILTLLEVIRRQQVGLEAIIDLHECDPSYNSVERQSEVEHERFKYAQDTLTASNDLIGSIVL